VKQHDPGYRAGGQGGEGRVWPVAQRHNNQGRRQVKCYNCNGNHFARDCTEPRRPPQVQSTQAHFNEWIIDDGAGVHTLEAGWDEGMCNWDAAAQQVEAARPFLYDPSL
jgi:hypothetical protein